ncbi:MAG: alpha/beta hydrolase-fold protein, partial [Anaerolineae bacterium]|nr:alpha/beta hydrolase-fold protein [Anaerolineae bacterium]
CWRNGWRNGKPARRARSSAPHPAPTSRPADAAVASTPSAVPSLLPSPTPASVVPPSGLIEQGRFFSPALDADGRYVIYLPPDYATGHLRYPVFYLLHGKGGGMNDWLHMKPDFDRLIAAGQVPPFIAVLPDAPYSRRASYYVDSAYGGDDAVPAGAKVETAFTRDLIAHIDATYRTIPTRAGRVVGGYSMGGWGAMRYALAHPDLYRAAIVLSPAVYVPFPPAESGMRAFGAFGKGALLFDEATYTEHNYPATLERVFKPSGLELAVFIAAGDDEHHYTRPEDREHDMDFEAHRLYNVLVRTPGIKAELRILQGTHCWDVWRPAFIEAAQYVAQFLAAPAP